MITKTDVYIIKELFERIENEEIDTTTALDKLEEYRDAQRYDSQTKGEQN